MKLYIKKVRLTYAVAGVTRHERIKVSDDSHRLSLQASETALPTPLGGRAVMITEMNDDGDIVRSWWRSAVYIWRTN